MSQYLDSLVARQNFRQDMEHIATRYQGMLPQGWEDALHNILDVIDKDTQ